MWPKLESWAIWHQLAPHHHFWSFISKASQNLKNDKAPMPLLIRIKDTLFLAAWSWLFVLITPSKQSNLEKEYIYIFHPLKIFFIHRVYTSHGHYIYKKFLFFSPRNLLKFISKVIPCVLLWWFWFFKIFCIKNILK
jgi:hypothetical protein